MFKEIIQLKAHNSRNRIAERRKTEGVSTNPLEIDDYLNPDNSFARSSNWMDR